MQYPVQQAGHYYSLRPPQGHAVHSWDGTSVCRAPFLAQYALHQRQTTNNNIPHSSNNLYTGQGTREIGLSIQLENSERAPQLRGVDLRRQVKCSFFEIAPYMPYCCSLMRLGYCKCNYAQSSLFVSIRRNWPSCPSRIIKKIANSASDLPPKNWPSGGLNSTADSLKKAINFQPISPFLALCCPF
jgi:hypothetical protein